MSLFSLIEKLSYISRKRKLDLFYRLMKPSDQTSILDVGGIMSPDNSQGLQLIDTFQWKHKLTVINISAEQIELIKQYYPEVTAVVGDACKLPWPNKYFDIVYSNAVIEHVGDREKQQEMAREIMRVSKRWFVATPNRYFPFEFHLCLPFVTWLPENCYHSIGKCVIYDFGQKRHKFWPKNFYFRLLSARELGQLFRGSKIIKQRVTFMSETLISVGEDIQNKRHGVSK